jgi:ADP-heptose:LPS heptosyltransferase
MNNYLIFRTDRIGDFFISSILIKNIIENDSKANIVIVASEKNYSYIKQCSYVNQVYLLKNNFLDKFLLTLKLLRKKFHSIIIHDDKNRSKLISFFLFSKNKINIRKINYLSQIDIIKKILKKINFNYLSESLNILDHKKIQNNNEDYIQFHFDEKWIHKDYIDKYTKIEPSFEELLIFIKSVIKKTGKKLKITTGTKTPLSLKLINELPKNNMYQIYENLNFFQLEKITLNSSLLISCHGSISHIASAIEIKQIDIIDNSYRYDKWTKHFRNYIYLYRKNFKDLSNDILNEL